jgi:hypothetical protein
MPPILAAKAYQKITNFHNEQKKPRIGAAFSREGLP